MAEITRRFEFDYGHRVLGHEGKCKHLHGHRGVAEVTVSSPELDDLGRVLDFSVVKELVGKWIDENWDHNFLGHPDDPLFEDVAAVFGYKAPYMMPNGNPTAENMVAVLFDVADSILSPMGLKVVSCRFYETPNCRADHYASK